MLFPQCLLQYDWFCCQARSVFCMLNTWIFFFYNIFSSIQGIKIRQTSLCAYTAIHLKNHSLDTTNLHKLVTFLLLIHLSTNTFKCKEPSPVKSSLLPQKGIFLWINDVFFICVSYFRQISQKRIGKEMDAWVQYRTE